MSAEGYIQLRIEVRPSPETNDHEVRLLGDGDNLVDRFSSGSSAWTPTIFSLILACFVLRTVHDVSLLAAALVEL